MRPLLCFFVLASTIAHAQRAPLQSSAPETAPSRDESLWVPKPPDPEKNAEKPRPAPTSAQIASGSALGPWALVGAGAFMGTGTFVRPEFYGFVGLFTNLSAGWGFDVGRVQLRPAVEFGINAELTHRDGETSRFWASPINLSLAATNLLDEKVTGLRLTPAVGITIPTSIGRSIPITLLSGSLQLERHFGPLEVALRSDVGKPFYAEYPPICRLCDPTLQPRFNWFWVNTAQLEGWFTDSISLGVSYAWSIAFGFPVPSNQVSMVPRDANGNLLSPTFVSSTDTVTGRVFFTWAFSRLFGLSLDVITTQPPFFVDATGTRRVRFPFLSFGSWADNDTVISLGAWFRTDVALSRNWIER